MSLGGRGPHLATPADRAASAPYGAHSPALGFCGDRRVFPWRMRRGPQSTGESYRLPDASGRGFGIGIARFLGIGDPCSTTDGSRHRDWDLVRAARWLDPLATKPA